MCGFQYPKLIFALPESGGESAPGRAPARGRRTSRHEGRHHLACVRLEVRPPRHGPGDLLLGEERHDADHRCAAVVDLGEEALGLLLLGPLAREAKRVVQVEDLDGSDGDDARLGKVRVVTRPAALHVVRLHAELAPELEEADEGEDLRLCEQRERVPLLRRRQARGVRRRLGQAEREAKVESVVLGNVADKGEHRDAPVLDLSVPQPAPRRLVALRPEVGRREAERVKVADDRVQRSGELLLGVVHGDSSGARARERRRRAQRRREAQARGRERQQSHFAG
mmetsp:Transcript_17912/g.58413  ORF Transcript_17912/g.58413 Transcript_17912/m.58413 type:complete len:282 (+) Transcript_17912:115-960(+)